MKWSALAPPWSSLVKSGWASLGKSVPPWASLNLRIPDILLDSSREEYRLLTNKSNLIPQPLQTQVPDVNTVQEHLGARDEYHVTPQ